MSLFQWAFDCCLNSEGPVQEGVMLCYVSATSAVTFRLFRGQSLSFPLTLTQQWTFHDRWSYCVQALESALCLRSGFVKL